MFGKLLIVPRRVVMLLAALLSGCGSASTTASPAVATVGGMQISAALFAARLASAETAVAQAGGPQNNSAMITQLRTDVLRSLILDSVIAQEAAQLGIAATDAEVAAEVQKDATAAGGQAQLQSQLAAAGGSLLQLQDEIRAQLNEQRVEQAQAQQRAAVVEGQLQGQSEPDFASAAKQFSDDTQSQPQGGLMTLSASVLANSDPQFTKGVAGIAVGTYNHTPIRDNDGFEIIAVESRTAQTTVIRRILVAAALPYTVKARPAWFSEALFAQIQLLCQQGKISVYVANAGGNPCQANASSSTPSPAPTPR